MTHLRMFSVVCLLFNVLLSSRLAHAADPLHETVFLVGPEPQAIAFDNADNPVGSGSSNDSIDPVDMTFIPVPLSSASVQIDMGGNGRQLNDRRSLDSFHVTPAHQHDTRWKPDDSPISRHRVDRDHAFPVTTRSLAGETCNLTNTILSLKFDDNNAENGFFVIPGNPHGAVGSRRLVAVAGSVIEVRYKNGTQTYRDGLQSFFSRIPEATDAGLFQNAKVIYDEHEGRFVMAARTRTTTPPTSRLWLAVSTNDTPDSVNDWNFFLLNTNISISGSVCSANSLDLKVDEEAVYVTSDMFRFSDNGYQGPRYWLIRKGVVGGFYDGGVLSFFISNPVAGGGTIATTVPAKVHGSGGVDGSVGTFFLSLALKTTPGEYDLQVYTLFNPLSAAPSFTLQKIPLGNISQSFGMPSAPQRNSTNNLFTLDARVLDAVWRNNKLWAVLMVNPFSGVNQGQVTVHWIRCSTSGGNVTLEEQGDFGGEDIAGNTSTFYPSVAVNRRGLPAFGYSASSNTTFVGAYVSVGTSEQSYTVQSGLAPYSRIFSSGINFWGFFSAISVDPTDDSFWIFNQFADTTGSPNGGDGRWATVWGRLECTPAPTKAPTRAPTKAPTRAPTKAPIRAPTKAPTKAPTRLPTKTPTLAPVQESCGLFGLSLFCPLTFCGITGRFFGICRN